MRRRKSGAGLGFEAGIADFMKSIEGAEESKSGEGSLLVDADEPVINTVLLKSLNVTVKPPIVMVGCVKCHLSTIVAIFIHQYEDRWHNNMHYYVGVLSNHVVTGYNSTGHRGEE